MSEQKTPGECPIQQDERRTGAGIDIPVPWSKEPVRIRGLSIIMTMVLVALSITASLVWGIREDMTKDHKSLITQNAQIVEALTEQTYIQSLSDKERADLNLTIPPSLRNKLNGGRIR